MSKNSRKRSGSRKVTLRASEQVATVVNWSWWSIIRRVLLVVVLLLLLYTLTTFSSIALSPLAAPSHLGDPQWVRPVLNGPGKLQPWKKELEGAAPPLTRTVTISATSAGLQINLDLWVSLTAPLAALAANGRWDSILTQGTFGALRLHSSYDAPIENFSIPTWTIEPNTKLFQLHQETVVPLNENGIGFVWLDRPYSLFTPQSDEVVLKLGNMHLYAAQPVPDKSQAGMIILKRTAPERVPSVGLVVSTQLLHDESLQVLLQNLNTVLKPTDDSKLEKQKTVQDLLRALGQFAVPLADFWRNGLGLVLPLLIYWYWINQGPAAGWLELPTNQEQLKFTLALTSVVVSVLIFHFSVYILVEGDFIDLDPLFWLGRYNRQIFAFLGPWFNLMRGSDWISLIVLGVVVPAVLVQRAQTPPPRPRYWSWLARLILSLVIIFGGAWVAWETLASEHQVWKVSLGTTAICAVLMFLAFMGLHRVLAGKPTRPEIALLAVFALLAMQSLAAFGQAEDVWDSISVGLPPDLKDWLSYRLTMLLLGTRQTSLFSLFWTIIYTGLGAFLIVSLAHVALGFVHKISRESSPITHDEPRTSEQSAADNSWSLPHWVETNWARWLGLILAVLLAIPNLTSPGSSELTASAKPIRDLAFALAALSRLSWVGGVLWLMYQSGKTSQVITSFIHAVGLLTASTLFFNTTENWLYVPVTFLLGWWTLQCVVWPATYWDTLGPLFQPVFENRAKLLDQIVDLNDAEDHFWDGLKKQKAKWTDDEMMTFAKYHENIEKKRQELNDLKANAVIGKQQPVRDVALAFGPYASAWQNGLHGTRMSLLFAIPWLFLFVQRLLTQVVANPTQTYYVWMLVYSVLNVMANWFIFGFFFGYFYPYLWGKNGLEKGLVLFLATTLPTLPYMALTNTNAKMWQESLFVILQIFTQCMLLGLFAFDYFTLRQGRYGWKMLFEVYHIAAVSISLYSILAAVGVTVTTLLTNEANDWIKWLLNAFLRNITPPPGG